MLGHFVVTFSKLQNIGTTLLVVVCLSNEIFIGMFSRSLETRIKQKKREFTFRRDFQKSENNEKMRTDIFIGRWSFHIEILFYG